MEDNISPPVPATPSPTGASSTDTRTFVTTEGEHLVFEGMNIPDSKAAWLMGLETMMRVHSTVNVHADALRDGLLAAGVTLEDMLAELRHRREADSEQ